MADNSQRRRFSRDLSGLWTGYYAYDLTDDAIMFTAWIKEDGGKITGTVIVAVCKSDPDNGKFALKDKDAAMAAAFAFLRSKGAFPEDDGDDSDDMIFGDDDNLDDYE